VSQLLQLPREQQFLFLRSALGLFTLLMLLSPVACQNSLETPASLGIAYVGSAHLDLYAELDPGAAVSAELSFGESVEVLRRRRNFYYVRSASGAEGWTHRSGLFNAKQVAEVNALARFAAENPPQGEAVAFSTLNVHNHPNRSAPTIFQIQKDEKVTVVTHERHPRQNYDPGPLLDATSENAASRQNDSEERSEEEVLPPSPPPPPSLPAVWMSLSGLSEARIRELQAAGIGSAQGRIQVPSGDLWTLVVNQQKLAGWALQARLSPAIPERVAQYAEGTRIIAYFSLGPANAEGTVHHWLWTTLSSASAPGHWDSFRVFLWNNRLSRYETAMIQRGVEGYLPVEILDGEDAQVRRFRMAVRERSGLIHRKTYELRGSRVHLLQNVPWPNYDPAKQPPVMQRLPEPAVKDSVIPTASPGLLDRVFGR
jgi:hypothetical protein